MNVSSWSNVTPRSRTKDEKAMAYGAEMPPGATAQNAALGHLILDMLFSLRDCSFHDDRRSHYIHAYNFIL